jgi:DNA repair exonuclease SbcCD ATPase subunit
VDELVLEDSVQVPLVTDEVVPVNDDSKAEKNVEKQGKVEKEAKKLVDKAEKEAKKLAEKAEKEAKKLAEKAEKEAKKLAEKAEKEAKKVEKVEVEKEKEAKKVEVEKVDVEVEKVDVEVEKVEVEDDDSDNDSVELQVHLVNVNGVDCYQDDSGALYSLDLIPL